MVSSFEAFLHLGTLNGHGHIAVLCHLDVPMKLDEFFILNIFGNRKAGIFFRVLGTNLVDAVGTSFSSRIQQTFPIPESVSGRPELRSPGSHMWCAPQIDRPMSTASIRSKTSFLSASSWLGSPGFLGSSHGVFALY